YGTFASGTTDTNKRFIASIRAGYDGGTWGREYLDLWINRAPNDSNNDANQVRAMRITHGGRVVVGDRNDDTANAFQVGGNGAFSGGVAAGGRDSGGANFRLMNGKDVLLRNDGSNFYVLLSNGSGYGASWNDFRPITVNVATGVLSLDDTGAGTYVGGQLNVKGMLNISSGSNEGRALIGSSGGYFFGNASEAGFYLPSSGTMFALNFAKKNLLVNGKDVWHTGNLPNPAQTTGITMSGPILAAEGTVTQPGISFVNDGAPDTGFFHIADGVFAVANNGRETMRFLAVDGTFQNNRVLIGQPADDGNHLQVNGNATTRGLHRFGTGATTAWANSDAAWGYFRSNGHVSVGSKSATGVLQLIAGKAEVAKLVPGGRMTIAGTADR
ncbi:phage tail protein, partial [Pseudomonas sp. MWU12-2534b]